MPPIWDTLIRPGQPVASSTQLFTQYPSGPPQTSPAYFDPRYGLRSWSRRSYVDPRLVAAMTGEDDGGHLGDVLFHPLTSVGLLAAAGYFGRTFSKNRVAGAAIGAGIGYAIWWVTIRGSIIDPT